jgi:hypothetical protein
VPSLMTKIFPGCRSLLHHPPLTYRTAAITLPNNSMRWLMVSLRSSHHRIDRLALDQLHYEVGPTLFRDTAIQQSCNVRVIEGSKDSTFLLESGNDKGGVR